MFSYLQVQVVSCSLSVYRMRNVDTIVEFSLKIRSHGRRN
jgi:hypothetical protein